jgi:hypothetical protein
MVPRVPILLVLAILLGCADQTAERPIRATDTRERPPPIVEEKVDAGDADAGDAGPATPACAKRFGSEITPEFGRLDGFIRAVVAPGDPQCKNDDDHVYVQIDVGGATYVAAVNIESAFDSDARVRFAEIRAPLAFDPWSEGWHPSVGSFDYAYSLDVHSSDAAFEPLTSTDLASRLVTAVPIGAMVSIFMEGFDTGGTGGHKVHRNGRGEDGAIVVLAPGEEPRYLLFRFAGQRF